jgi:hypothetical protein
MRLQISAQTFNTAATNTKRILNVCFVLFLLAIVLSVLLRYTDSDCPFGIFKLFLFNIYHCSTLSDDHVHTFYYICVQLI